MLIFYIYRIFLVALLPIFAEVYHVKPVKTHDGVYFEKVGKMQLYSEAYNLHITIDTRGIINKVQETLDFINLMDYLNQNADSKMLIYQANCLLEKSKLLNNSPTVIDQKRFKRVIDTVGSLSKFLFGIMNDQDRSAILENVNSLYKGLQDVKKFAASSVILVQSQIDNYLDFKNLTQWNFSQVNKEYQKLGTNFTSSKVFNIKLNLDYLSNKIDSLLQILTFSKLNPTILSPIRFTSILKDIEKSLPKNRTLPFSPTFLTYYYTHLETNFEIFPNFIVLSYKIPILQVEIHEIKKLYTFPIKMENSTTFAILNVRQEYFTHALNKQTDYHLRSEVELNNCVIKTFDNYFCTNQRSSYTMFTKEYEKTEECIAAKAFSIEDKSACSDLYNVYNFNATIWYQISGNEWFFVAPFSTKIMIICDLDQIYEIYVNDMGIFTLNEKCKAHANVFLSPSLIFTHKVNIDLISHDFPTTDLTTVIQKLPNLLISEPIPSLNISYEKINTNKFLLERAIELKELANIYIKPKVVAIDSYNWFDFGFDSNIMLFGGLSITTILILIIVVYCACKCFCK